jgi:tetratricopeptide (TPR) repeat protein
MYRDHRDLTPFRTPVFRTPVRGLANGVGGAVSGVLSGRVRGSLPVEGGAPRLGKVGGRTPGKAARTVHAAIFGNSDPDRLIALAHAYPGWSGLCYLVAGLLSYNRGGYLRASELLQRGMQVRNEDDANFYASGYLTHVVTRVSVAERVEVPVLFSEEGVFLALSHALRETGQAEAALAALAGLPPSLPMALARSSLAATLGRHEDVVADTEGLLNGDDLSAALLLVRARSLRKLGYHEAARAALQEVLRRRKTDFTLRSDALTDRALLLLDNGRKALTRREWQHRQPAELETVRAIRKDAELHELWDREYGRADSE